jgi:predicted transcriptional regulator
MFSKHLHLSDDVAESLERVAKGERRTQSSLADELLRVALKQRSSNLNLRYIMEGAKD